MKEILKKYGIKPSKRLGQNFLIDKNVLKKIIEAAELKPDDIILEIGPGLGILTLELAKKVKKVIAVEKDRTLSQILKDVLKAEGINNVEVINKDILQISNFQFLISNYKIIANLPYYITSPVIRKFLESESPPQEMILMVQKEVAQRICAKPPRMNLLAVAVQFYVHPVRNKISNGAEPEIISYVSRNSFWPQPKVDSAIIKIVPRVFGYLYPKTETERFFKLVKAGFSSKRKMLKNNLSSTSLEARKIEKILKEIGLNPKIRAENLSIQDWIKLYEIYNQISKK